LAAGGGSVVLVRDRGAGCDVLLRALSARGLSPVTVHDEPSAMLALAGLADRGLGRRVLIVVEPARWPRLDQLTQAVRGYHGSVHVWQFDHRDGADPMLSQLEAMPARNGGEDASSAVGPVGQIRKRDRAVDRLLVKPTGQVQSPREVVTQQELTMLLGPVPGEAG